MGIFNKQDKRNFRTQFLIRDDGKCEFIRREVEDRFFVERDVKEEVSRGWLHSYTNQYNFDGYGKIRPDMVTIGYERNYLLDIYGVVPVIEKSNFKTEDKAAKHNQKPADARDPWLVGVGNNSRLKIEQNRGKGTNYDKIVMYLGFFLLSEVLVILLEIILKRF